MALLMAREISSMHKHLRLKKHHLTVSGPHTCMVNIQTGETRLGSYWMRRLHVILDVNNKHVLKRHVDRTLPPWLVVPGEDGLGGGVGGVLYS
jgi:hypothetical protein